MKKKQIDPLQTILKEAESIGEYSSCMGLAKLPHFEQRIKNLQLTPEKEKKAIEDLWAVIL